MTNRAIWLKSTNEKNTSFYSFHGYKVVDAVVLGDDNPDWHNAPVVVKIVRNNFSCQRRPFHSYFTDGPRTSSTEHWGKHNSVISVAQIYYTYETYLMRM